MDNLGGLFEREGVAEMKQGYAHIYPPVINNLYKANPRTEQGFYHLPTDNRSSYYDYLYIHTSSYANNLSTHILNYENLKSRG